MELVVVIPARGGSTRIPAKPFLKVGDKYLIDLLIERVRNAFGDISITLTSESSDVLDSFRGQAVRTLRTSTDIFSGTERAAEVAKTLGPCNVLVLPCDVYFANSEVLSSYVGTCIANGYSCATLAKLFSDDRYLIDTSAVKMLTDRTERAFYYARTLDGTTSDYGTSISQQLGIYFYSSQVLQRFLLSAGSSLERMTNNESFRFLLDGVAMYRVLTHQPIYSLNTLSDLDDLELQTGMRVTYGNPNLSVSA